MSRRMEWEDYPPPVRDEASGCLRWQGPHHTRGYGRLGKRYAHRMAWEREHGPIPEGLTIDHVLDRGCVWRDCVEVAHLEPVPQSVNTARSRRSREQRARTSCPHGHAYSEENTIRKAGGRRECRQCGRIRNARNYRRRKAGRS